VAKNLYQLQIFSKKKDPLHHHKLKNKNKSCDVKTIFFLNT